ncbi:MAG: DUF1731 domain-containing protein [Planctomycetaceae bacterium]|nr:DUF1731 domain-containing protein [Planctomycetaceae bacterium]
MSTFGGACAVGGTREAKDEFSVKVATAWEEEFDRLPLGSTRRVALRTAMVFGREPGTVYPILRRLAKLGLAGSLAGGQQYVSWIHELDFCRAISWLLARDDLEGPVNVAAPQPLTNAELMRSVRATCGRRLGLPASRWMLELGAFVLRTETELLIKSRRVVPERLLNSGFTFLFPDLQRALAELEVRGRERMADREAIPLETAAICSDQVS